MSHNYPTTAIFALAAAGEQAVFAATEEGLFVSGDNLKSWENAYHTLNASEAIPTFAILPSPDYVEDQFIVVGVAGGILFSTDGGAHWHHSMLPEPAPVVSSLLFTEDGTLLAATADDGVFRSPDRGKTWQEWNFGLLDRQINYLTQDEDGTIYAGCESGVFISMSNGRSWQELPFPMELAPVLSMATNNKTILLGTENHGLFISTDKGQTWQNNSQLEGTIEFLVKTANGICLIHENRLLLANNDWQNWKTMPQSKQEITAVTSNHKGELFLGFKTGTVIKIADPTL